MGNDFKKVKVQKLTAEAFAPYGYIVGDGPDYPVAKDAKHFANKNFTFYPELGTLKCDYDHIEVGYAHHYLREYTTDRMERHYHTQELMIPFNHPMVLIFAKNAGTDPEEKPDIDQVEAFLINTNEGVVVDPFIWHWTPFSVGGDTDVVCLFAKDTGDKDCFEAEFSNGGTLELVFED